MAEGGLQSGLLPEYEKRLIHFIGQGNKGFQLLYSATKDKFSVEKFHRDCDDRGPTVTVLYTTNDNVFGGYTSKSWTEVQRGYVSDPTAFLFHLKKDEGSWRFDKFPCNDTKYAIFCDPNKAAVFGKRDDFHSMNRPAPWNDSRTLPSGVTININSYDMKNVDLAFLCNDVTKIEVHKVEDARDSKGRLSAVLQGGLVQCIGQEKKIFKLLYSATRDTCSPEAFHRHCDGKEPTVTVLHGKGNFVFGGYTSMSWAKAERGYVSDPTAFLFQLKEDKDGISFTKFPCQDKNYAIFCDPSKAAVFGEGPDLHLMNGPITWNEWGTFNLDGEIKFSSYDMQGVNEDGFCNAALEVKEIEVYSITDEKGIIQQSPGDGFDSRILDVKHGDIRVKAEKQLDAVKNEGPAPQDEQKTTLQPKENQHAKEDAGEPDQADLLTEPWRACDIDWTQQKKSDEDLRLELKKYVPRHQEVDSVNVLLFGPVGVGKSSFVNTAASAFEQRILNIAESGCVDSSLTKMFTRYTIRKDPAKPQLNLCDTPGLQADNLMTEENMEFLLHGNFTDKVAFEPSQKSEKSNQKPRLSRQIHCVAIFFTAASIDSMTETMPDIIQNIKAMKDVMDNKGVRQVIILTKVDQLCQESNQDLSNVYRSRTVKQCVTKVSKMFGLPKEQVFPVKNYEHGGHLNTAANILTMYALKMILEHADAFFYRFPDKKPKNS